MSKFDIAYRDVIKRRKLALVAMLLVVFNGSDGYCNAGIPVYMRR